MDTQSEACAVFVVLVPRKNARWIARLVFNTLESWSTYGRRRGLAEEQRPLLIRSCRLYRRLSRIAKKRLDSRRATPASGYE